MKRNTIMWLAVCTALLSIVHLVGSWSALGLRHPAFGLFCLVMSGLWVLATGYLCNLYEVYIKEGRP